MKYSICYVSSLSTGISENEVKSLLEYSEESNKSKNFTGFLLFSEGNFFQVLEGPEDEIDALFNKIKNDTRHYDIMRIFKKHLPLADHDGYKSDFISEDKKMPGAIRKYMKHVTAKEPATRQIIKNMLQLFVDGD